MNVTGATLEDRGLAGRRLNKIPNANSDGVVDDGYAFPQLIERFGDSRYIRLAFYHQLFFYETETEIGFSCRILDKIPFARRLPIFSSHRAAATVLPETGDGVGGEGNGPVFAVASENKVEAAIIKFVSR
jgi:hypothetical protein